MGLDEKSFLKGQSYVTVCNDIGGKRVLEVVPGRDTDSGKTALGKLPPEAMAKVEAVAVDLCPAYAAAVGESLPDALVVADKFHVVKLFNEMLKIVRRDEHAQMSAKGDGRLKNTRNLFLKRRENLNPEQDHHFDALARANLKTSRAWLLRENFSGFWSCADYEEAVGFFGKWYHRAIRHSHKEIKKLARTLRENLHKLVNHITSPITNAFSEGINSKIQAIKAAARGFRSFKNYRTRILFFCGKLDFSFA